jgi:hypothetical protein
MRVCAVALQCVVVSVHVALMLRCATTNRNLSTPTAGGLKHPASSAPEGEPLNKKPKGSTRPFVPRVLACCLFTSCVLCPSGEPPVCIGFEEKELDAIRESYAPLQEFLKLSHEQRPPTVLLPDLGVYPQRMRVKKLATPFIVRPEMLALCGMVLEEGKDNRLLYVDGPNNAGKSVIGYATVAMLRAQGRDVIYVPDCESWAKDHEPHQFFLKEIVGKSLLERVFKKKFDDGSSWGDVVLEALHAGSDDAAKPAVHKLLHAMQEDKDLVILIDRQNKAFESPQIGPDVTVVASLFECFRGFIGNPFFSGGKGASHVMIGSGDNPWRKKLSGDTTEKPIVAHKFTPTQMDAFFATPRLSEDEYKQRRGDIFHWTGCMAGECDELMKAKGTLPAITEPVWQTYRTDAKKRFEQKHDNFLGTLAVDGKPKHYNQLYQLFVIGAPGNTNSSLINHGLIDASNKPVTPVAAALLLERLLDNVDITTLYEDDQKTLNGEPTNFTESVIGKAWERVLWVDILRATSPRLLKLKAVSDHSVLEVDIGGLRQVTHFAGVAPAHLAWGSIAVPTEHKYAETDFFLALINRLVLSVQPTVARDPWSEHKFDKFLTERVPAFEAAAGLVDPAHLVVSGTTGKKTVALSQGTLHTYHVMVTPWKLEQKGILNKKQIHGFTIKNLVVGQVPFLFIVGYDELQDAQLPVPGYVRRLQGELNT